MILAPHPDDEVVACGLSACRARQDGAQLFVLHLTNGVPPRKQLWRWQRSGYAARIARRRREAAAAARLLGLETVGFLDIPSRCLRFHLDQATAAIESALTETGASEIWVPAFEGAHQDHDACNAIAARFLDRKWVREFAAYNYAGGKVSSNWFFDTRGGVVEHHLSREEARLKQKALRIYASESGNLLHVGVSREAWRPLPRYNYGAPPHPGRLFRERFHWVPFRHPRIDFTPSTEIYSLLGEWSAAHAAVENGGTEGEVQHVSLSR